MPAKVDELIEQDGTHRSGRREFASVSWIARHVRAEFASMSSLRRCNQIHVALRPAHGSPIISGFFVSANSNR
jgi:hypothetical protein